MASLSKRKKLYKLTDGDRAIFERAKRENNPSIVTNYYLRSDKTGTWFRHVSDEDIADLTIDESIEVAHRWQSNFETLHAIWKHLGKPGFFAPSPTDPDDWSAINEEEYNARREEMDVVYRCVHSLREKYPAFHHPHGIRLIDWQTEMAQSNQAVQVIVGGFGSSKTWGKLLIMLYNAITLDEYRGIVLAPYSIQVFEAYRQATINMIEGTLFERFILNTPRRPPQIILGNDEVGENTIEFIPIMDDPGKILTLSGDEVMVDQAEQIDDLDELIRNAGTRLRGQTRAGRPRLGQITLIANSADNPMLWDWFDDALTQPRYVWSYQPGTFENPYLTVADLMRFERQVGRSEAERRMYLFGERPIGAGEHFPRESLELCRAKYLDDRMAEALKNGISGWKMQRASRVDVHLWESPYVKGSRYVVCADPGWGDPPYRNSAVIAVWCIDGFPKTPAVLVAFSWVFGGGSPNPWIQQYIDWVHQYHAINQNGYDSTGWQAGYERMADFEGIGSTPVSVGGGNKYIYLNILKKMMADGKFAIPTITHLFSQCAKYRLPDEKLRQDIVAMLEITAAMLEQYYYIDDKEPETDDTYDRDDRYSRPGVGDRYGDHSR